MAKEHNTITDPEIHEPKGVATAAAGDVYVANGSGGGAWEVNGGQDYRVAEISDNTTEDIVLLATADFSVGTNYKKITVAAGWGDVEGNTLTLSSDVINLDETGLYDLQILCSVQLISGTGNIVLATKVSNDGATTGLPANKSLHTLDFVGDIRTFSGSSVFTFQGTDTVSFFVAADTACTLRFRECRMAVSKLSS